MVMPIVGMKAIGAVAPVLTAGVLGVVTEIVCRGYIEHQHHPEAPTTGQGLFTNMQRILYGALKPVSGISVLHLFPRGIGAAMFGRLITGCISGMLPVALALLPCLRQRRGTFSW